MAQSKSPNRGDGVTQRLQALTLTEALPRRPATGSLGKQIQVATNYFTFDISPPPHAMLARYTVTVQPRAVGKKLARIIELYLQEISHGDRFAYISDFASIILDLQQPRGNDLSVPPVPPTPPSRMITYRPETWDTATPNAPTYTVTQTFDRYLNISGFMRQLRNGHVDEQYATRQEMIQALNIWTTYQFKRSDNFLTVGRHRKFEKRSGAKIDIGGGIVARRGFFTSLRLAANSLQLNVNTTHATFYPECTLDRYLSKLLEGTSPEAVARFIRKIRVVPTHLSAGKNKDGKPIVKTKTILGWASSADGHGYDQARRPRVRNCGKPHEVEFFVEERNRYYTVYDYFKSSECY
jgi:eukaryotic translation initiation factor 2C